MPRKGEKGFTLIELLIVVAIIGILAAIAILQFAAHRERAIEGSMISDLRNAATAVAALHTDAQTYENLGPPDPTAEGPGTVRWVITGTAFEATSPLSRGNRADVVGAAGPNDFRIQIANPAAREGRRAVTINQAGAISWYATAQ